MFEKKQNKHKQLTRPSSEFLGVSFRCFSLCVGFARAGVSWLGQLQRKSRMFWRHVFLLNS